VDKVSGIYKITNVKNGKFYIGSSTDVKGRIRGHRYLLNSGKHENIHLLSAWNKYGKRAFIFEILETNLNKILLEVKEQEYIDTLKPQYNMVLKANTRLEKNHVMAEATKEKISRSLTGRVRSPEVKKRIVRGLKKSYRENPDHSKNISISLKKYNKNNPDVRRGKNNPFYGVPFFSGKKHSKKTILKMSKSQKLRMLERPETFGKKKPTLQFTKNGIFIKRWESASSVARSFNSNRGSIIRCCLGHDKSHKGFVWKYEK
jgi:group I intron endonuclease